MQMQFHVCDQEKIIRSKKIFGWGALICGLGFLVAPLIGIAEKIIGIVEAFSELGKSGSADPEAVAGDISVVLLTMFWGIIFSIPLLIAFVVFLILFLKSRKVLSSLLTKKIQCEQDASSHP